MLQTPILQLQVKNSNPDLDVPVFNWKETISHSLKLLKGDLNILDKITDTFNWSLLSAISEKLVQPTTSRYIWMKWVGTHGDHAEDQKSKDKVLGKIKKERSEPAHGSYKPYLKQSGLI